MPLNRKRPPVTIQVPDVPRAAQWSELADATAQKESVFDLFQNVSGAATINPEPIIGFFNEASEEECPKELLEDAFLIDLNKKLKDLSEKEFSFDQVDALSDDEQDIVCELGLAMENQTIMSHADEEQIKMFFTKLKSKKSFRMAFMNLPDDLQRKVLMLPNGQLSLGEYTLNNMDNKEFVDPNSIELPERRAFERPQSFITTSTQVELLM